MRKIILFSLILILCTSCYHDSFSPEYKKFFGDADTLIFKQKGFNTGMKLLLAKKGVFNYVNYWKGCVGGGEEKTVSGTFKLQNMKLFLFPDSVKLKRFPFNSHSNPVISTNKYTEDSLRIKTKFDILEWNNITYLLSPEKVINYNYHKPIFIVGIDNIEEAEKRNEYYQFAMNYNSGYEPEFHGKYLVRIDEKSKDSTNSNLDLMKIPKEWRKLFLENPITAKVIKLETKTIEDKNDKEFNYEQQLVHINKGRDDGVIVGLTFSTDSNRITIIKALDHKSIGVNESDLGNEINIGLVLKTK